LATKIGLVFMMQHPEPHVRRAVRVLAMVGELRRRGYQKIRVMPFMSPSGNHWRCWIGPDTLFYRDHGAFLCATDYSEGLESDSVSARYTSGDENHYFGWKDAENDGARSLASGFRVISLRLRPRLRKMASKVFQTEEFFGNGGSHFSLLVSFCSPISTTAAIFSTVRSNRNHGKT
jgi:hypothetical protein